MRRWQKSHDCLLGLSSIRPSSVRDTTFSSVKPGKTRWPHHPGPLLETLFWARHLVWKDTNIHTSAEKSFENLSVVVAGSVNVHPVVVWQDSYQPVGPHPVSTGPGPAAITVVSLEKKKRRKVSFQQIWNKTFFPPLPLLKGRGPAFLTSGPFESLSRRTGLNASSRPWLMFKEKIMEIRCRDHTR